MSYAQREVAKRVFAREFNDSTYMFAESQDEMAPQYALMPTGDRMNRVLIAGTLTETEDVGGDSEYWRGRIVDPTGTFFVYAGEYQPEAMGMLQRASPPDHVVTVGKPRTYETDEGDTNVSLRPERIASIEDAVRQRWIVETAERTIERLIAFEKGEREDVIRARDVYGDDVSSYRNAVIEALEGLETQEQLETRP